MGDFSFYDPAARKVVVVGELKTVSEAEGARELQMTFIMQYDSPLGTALMNLRRVPERPKPSAVISDRQAQRLRRQVNQIAQAFKKAESPKDVHDLPVSTKIDWTKFNRVLECSSTEGVSFDSIGKSHLVFAIFESGSIAKERWYRKVATGQRNWLACRKQRRRS
jgi:hypothetical protein